MSLRKLSIVFLLIFVFIMITACQNTSNQEKQPEDGSIENPVGSTSPTNSAEKEPGQLPDATEEPVKEDSVGVDAADDLPPFDLKNIEPYFQGEEGAFVWKAINEDEYIVFNEKLAKTGFSPCSTFKIPNALIGLELGVVQDKRTLKKWDGTIYRVKDWNRDHTLESAIQYSAVWYFKELARGIGAENMQKLVDAMDYGNANISGGIDRFWLDSTLKITPYEQVEFLEKLYKGDLPFREENIKMVKEMIVLDKLEGGTLSGKTGTGNDGGWFVGYYETPKEVYLFSAYIKNKQGREVKETVMEILNEANK